jgi:hypothetical protein
MHEEKEIDIDGDGTPEVVMTLLGIRQGRAQLSLKIMNADVVPLNVTAYAIIVVSICAVMLWIKRAHRT